MRIVVTGAGGQLGSDLLWVPRNGNEVIGLTRADMDITEFDTVQSVMREIGPDAIIHAAAYTAVDEAESEPDSAYAVNAVGTRNVAVIAEAIGANLCYVSTDYVFDGQGTSPYGEYDDTHPQSVYGASKRAGELLVRSLSTSWFIVRTSWLYSAYGANFVKTMLAKAQEGARLRVVADQVGAPTYTKDLAAFLIELVATEKYGIYHTSNTGVCSWYDFARAIFEETGVDPGLEACTTADFPRPAPRPAYSVLGHTAMRINGFSPLRPWREALRAFLKEGGR